MNIIAHNLLSMNANRNLNITGKKKAKTTEMLSSGYRINRSADDAAGLAISEKMRRQIRGLTQGVENTQEGVSLCQVADGALNEVSDILNRMEELSVKAANDTNTPEDRSYIQQEIHHLLQEIDRISDTTTFNEIPLFRGSDSPVMNSDGTPAIEGDIPFSDFQLADMTLGTSPFSSQSPGYQLGLQAVVKNPDLSAYGHSYNLIYGSGNTSSSSLRIRYTDSGGTERSNTVSLSSLTPSNYQTGTDSNGKQYWSRDFSLQNSAGINVTVTQKVTLAANTDSDKKYALEYIIQNQSSHDLSVDFMFHADTAYNNNDLCEGYYVGGSRVEKDCIYSKSESSFTAGSTNSNVINGVPDSLSIVDVDEALAFSEKISFGADSKPDSFSIGQYYSIKDWSYYDNLDSNLGGSAIRQDLGFSLLWNREIGAGENQTMGFSYGITATEQDANLAGVPITSSKEAVTDHSSQNPIWIHSGEEPGDGIEIVIEEMNTSVLGIASMDVSTREGAENAITLTKLAQKHIMAGRSLIGAQQNRLEHTIDNENNIVENTTAAESRIRDTDMPSEIVRNSLQDILSQAGISMLAQANQSNQGVMNLLG